VEGTLGRRLRGIRCSSKRSRGLWKKVRIWRAYVNVGGWSLTRSSSVLVVCAGAVGYPLDEAAAGSSLLNLAGTLAGAQTSPRVKAEAPAVSLLAQGPGGQGQQMRVRAPIVDVAGLSAVAHLYQPGSFQNNGGTGNSGGAAPTSGAARQSSGQYAGVGGSSSGGPGSAHTQPPLVRIVLAFSLEVLVM
jgi:hypothetical protein